MKVEKTTINSTKGKLSVAIHRPDKETEQLAILCPGFLDSKDYKGLVGLADVLCARGYTIVRLDPTGTWDSEGNISEYTTSQYLEDVKHVLGFMLQEDGYTHVLLGGHSRGGMVAIIYAARDKRISTVLGIMPSSGRSLMGRRREQWQKTGYSDPAESARDLPDGSGTRVYRVPFSHVEDRDQYDVFEDIKKVHVPVLLLAGEKDALVLPEDVERLYKNANKPKKLKVIQNIGHEYRHNDDEVKIVNNNVMDLLLS